MKKILPFALLLGLFALESCSKPNTCSCETVQDGKFVQRVRRETRKDCATLNSENTVNNSTTKVTCTKAGE